MSNVTRSAPATQPEWLMRPCWSREGDDLIPGGKAGLLKLTDGQVYLVEPTAKAVLGRSFTMVKANGEMHVVCLERQTCSCKAFTYRKHNTPCKHLTQLADALLQLQGFDPFDGPDADAEAAGYDYTPPKLYLGDVVLFPTRGDDGPRAA